MNSRLKLFSKVLLLLVFTIFSCKNFQENTSTQKLRSSKDTPNIILIIADDAGWNDMSYHGSVIKTPNIDHMAGNGLELNRFYVSPTCSPTRASILTGMPSSRMGIVAPISGRSNKAIPDSLETLPRVLNEAGYETALIGKWHLGLKPESGPEAYGFDYSYGFLHGQIDQYTHNYKNGDSSWHRNGKFINEKGHATDLLTNDAIKWIESKEVNKPFFLQLAYSAPHIPLQEEEIWKKPYQDLEMDSSRKDYAAAMSHLDDAIGKILETLVNKNLSDNTLVVFISDNGAQQHWYPETQYDGKFSANETLGSNEPLRDFKTTNYEGAIRAPAIFYWPDKIKHAQFNNYVSAQDLMPTFLEVAGVKNKLENIEGISFWAAIGSSSKINSEIYIRGHLQESFITKPWKLIRTRHLNSEAEFELYNIEMDISEKKDLKEEFPDITKSLMVKLEKHFAKDADSVNVELTN